MILETLVDIKIKYCIVYLRPKIHSMNFSKCLNVKVKIMILKKREGMVSLALCDYFLCSYDKHNMISLFFFFYTVLPFYLDFFFIHSLVSSLCISLLSCIRIFASCFVRLRNSFPKYLLGLGIRHSPYSGPMLMKVPQSETDKHYNPLQNQYTIISITITFIFSLVVKLHCI